jgi:hypothetical protein
LDKKIYIKMERKVIEWTLDDEDFAELRRISLVTEPATEEEFLLFNKDILQFKTIDEERRVVTGVAMRADIQIPRKDENGELYWGYFSKETVRKAAELFFKKGSNTNLTNLEHQFEIEGVYVFESWIVEDASNDKAKVLGFSDVKEGDWFVSMKIENDVIWNAYLKTGIIKGFSVEVKAKEKEVEMLSKIKNILDSNDADDVKYEKIYSLLL